jgi:SAM-dependent methyltransferase
VVVPGGSGGDHVTQAPGPGPSQQQVGEDFDQITQNYERDINQALAFSGMEHGFFIDVKRDRLVDFVREHFDRDPADLDTLDLGCGLGAYHPRLKGVFHELHGIDVSAESIRLAAAEHPFVHYASFDGDILPYADSRFDVIFTICVMHHVPPANWPQFLDEMRRVLKPGGLAVVFEHNPYNPATQYIVRSCPIDKDAVLIRPGKLRHMFDAAGFSGIRTRTLLSVPPKGRVLSALDTALGHLPFGAQYSLRATKPA